MKSMAYSSWASEARRVTACRHGTATRESRSSLALTQNGHVNKLGRSLCGWAADQSVCSFILSSSQISHAAMPFAFVAQRATRANCHPVTYNLGVVEAGLLPFICFLLASPITCKICFDYVWFIAAVYVRP